MAPDPIASVTEVGSTNRNRNPRGEELSSAGHVRGVKAIVNVIVKRTNGKSAVQELRGTYKITPDPHDNPAYNKKRQAEFYLKAAQAAARAVTTAPDYALVAVDKFQFKFEKMTHRANPWDGPIDNDYRNRWKVDGDEVPPP